MPLQDLPDVVDQRATHSGIGHRNASGAMRREQQVGQPSHFCVCRYRLLREHIDGRAKALRRAHFDDREFRVPADGEDRQGDADMVVEIALCCISGVRAREDCMNEFLRGGLAVAASDGDKRDIELPPVVEGQVLQGRYAALYRGWERSGLQAQRA